MLSLFRCLLEAEANFGNLAGTTIFGAIYDLQNCMYVFDFATKTWSEIQASGLLPSVRSCPAWAKDETHVVRSKTDPHHASQ